MAKIKSVKVVKTYTKEDLKEFTKAAMQALLANAAYDPQYVALDSVRIAKETLDVLFREPVMQLNEKWHNSEVE